MSLSDYIQLFLMVYVSCFAVFGSILSIFLVGLVISKLNERLGWF